MLGTPTIKRSQRTLVASDESFSWRALICRLYLAAGLSSSLEVCAKQEHNRSISRSVLKLSRRTSDNTEEGSLGVIGAQHGPRIQCLQQHNSGVGKPQEVPGRKIRESTSGKEVVHAYSQQGPSGVVALHDVACVGTCSCSSGEQAKWWSR
jgi:hypothetical protein